MSENPVAVAWTELRELKPDEVGCLSPDEVRRAGLIKLDQRRNQFLCGRALLRTLLQAFTSRPASSHKLAESSAGKPICCDGPAVSISHRGGIVICAVSGAGDIGVDIDLADRQRNASGIAENYFAEDEATWLQTQPEERFYMHWVLKEAWLKAIGTGLAGGLDRLRCRVVPPKIEANDIDNPHPVLRLFEIDEMLAGLAMTAPLKPTITVYHWRPDNLELDAYSGARLIASTAELIEG